MHVFTEVNACKYNNVYINVVNLQIKKFCFIQQCVYVCACVCVCVCVFVCVCLCVALRCVALRCVVYGHYEKNIP